MSAEEEEFGPDALLPPLPARHRLQKFRGIACRKFDLWLPERTLQAMDELPERNPTEPGHLPWSTSALCVQLIVEALQLRGLFFADDPRRIPPYTGGRRANLRAIPINPDTLRRWREHEQQERRRKSELEARRRESERMDRQHRTQQRAKAIAALRSSDWKPGRLAQVDLTIELPEDEAERRERGDYILPSERFGPYLTQEAFFRTRPKRPWKTLKYKSLRRLEKANKPR